MERLGQAKGLALRQQAGRIPTMAQRSVQILESAAGIAPSNRQLHFTDQGDCYSEGWLPSANGDQIWEIALLDWRS